MKILLTSLINVIFVSGIMYVYNIGLQADGWISNTLLGVTWLFAWFISVMSIATWYDKSRFVEGTYRIKIPTLTTRLSVCFLMTGSLFYNGNIYTGSGVALASFCFILINIKMICHAVKMNDAQGKIMCNTLIEEWRNGRCLYVADNLDKIDEKDLPGFKKMVRESNVDGAEVLLKLLDS